MIYFWKVIIFAFFLLHFAQLHGSNAQRPQQTKYMRKTVLNDLTKGLSDAEIEKALSDLSLADLYELNKLIDASTAAENDYDEDGFLSSNAKRRSYQPTKYNTHMADNECNDENYDENEGANGNINDASNLVSFKIPRESLHVDSLRAKRENSQQNQNKLHVNEEYLKQLENSFPQDQNEHEYTAEKKEHIRIKRN